ncbi:saccharopine dehydrogenase family protein [Gemmobacter sp.]|uniref:saccharopine dehydrogenase family protein n=1 Tax=Gemmobacter sp. TaxID=1898957 RepID=UPI002AFE94AE|nr:saccharopine dehydrogenase C-terminal domain-containing protein [Gemmobacter sp.]
MAIPVLILGSGRMAQRIARVFAGDPRFAPTLAARDSEGPAIPGLPMLPPLTGTLSEALAGALRGQAAVVLADPALTGAEVARAAIAAGCHYLDIVESAASGAAIARLAGAAQEAGVALAPGCGLAPGWVTALAAEALEQAASQDEITVFVGVLPAQVTNRLGYANIWGIEGLVAEYTAPCLAIRDGELTELPPLADLETVHFGGLGMEAFTTAGSLDVLARDWQGRVAGLVFKTLRHPGHLDYIRFLLDDLGLDKRLYQFRTLLTTALPRTEQDRVLVAIRRRSGTAEHWSSQVMTAACGAGGGPVSAVSTITAAHVGATLDLIGQGVVPPGLIAPGALRPGDLRRSAFFGLLAPAEIA